MTSLHRVALLISTILAVIVGGWAFALPTRFYSSFPGFGLRWISADGPFNEHLIRDVGAMYLALAAASVVGLIRRSRDATVVLGAAWTTFGVLHFGYHAAHLAEMSVTDAVGNVVTLGLSLLLGIVLLVPAGRIRSAEEAVK